MRVFLTVRDSWYFAQGDPILFWIWDLAASRFAFGWERVDVRITSRAVRG